jgi:hypothetical protein
MSLDKKIISEIERYRNINNYILEQAAAPPPPDLGALAPAPGEIGAGAPPPPAPAEGTPPAAPQHLNQLTLIMTLTLRRLMTKESLKKRKDEGSRY